MLQVTNETVAVPGLAWRRQHLFFSQTELARVSGITRQTIARLEGGDRAAPRTVRKLAEALNCEPQELTLQLSASGRTE